MTLDASLLARAIPEGSMRYFAWLYSPKEKRDIIAALFLLESELRDTANAPHDVAHIRLQWWRDEIGHITKGNAQHPATRVLQARHNGNIDNSLFDSLILTTAQDIAHSTYETDIELNQYLKGGMGTLLKLAAAYLNDAPTPTILATAEGIGAFIRQVETLRDLRTDVHHGRLYLPLHELDQLNIEYEALAAKEWSSAFVEWLKARCHQSLQQYTQLKDSLVKEEALTLRPLLILGALHEKLLSRLRTDPDNFNQRLELSAFDKLWTAWRAARQH